MKFNDLTLWRLQRKTAIYAVPLVLIHLILQYLVFGVETISYETVSVRIQAGVILLVDLALLITVSLHAFVGIRGIVYDYSKDTNSERITNQFIFGLMWIVVTAGSLTLFAFWKD